MRLYFNLYVRGSHLFVSRMYSYIIRMSLLCTRMSSVCQWYVLVPHLYVNCMYSYFIRMSLVCTGMSSVCHSPVVLPWTEMKYTILLLSEYTFFNFTWTFFPIEHIIVLTTNCGIDQSYAKTHIVFYNHSHSRAVGIWFICIWLLHHMKWSSLWE